MYKYYRIDVQEENGTATQVTAEQKEEYLKLTENFGVYFIGTSFCPENEQTLWTIYNAIREIESTFRCLKSDPSAGRTGLDLRPIYHKNDDATMAYLHLGLLAYWLVNTIKHQLKKKGINHNWQEIVRITNTQMIIATTGQNKFEEVLKVRKCSQPNDKVMGIYQALNYKKYLLQNESP